MLPLLDTQVRLVLLNHVTVRLAGAGPEELSAAGLAGEMLDSLRRLSATDLNRLASMRSGRGRATARAPKNWPPSTRHAVAYDQNAPRLIVARRLAVHPL